MGASTKVEHINIYIYIPTLREGGKGAPNTFVTGLLNNVSGTLIPKIFTGEKNPIKTTNSRRGKKNNNNNNKLIRMYLFLFKGETKRPYIIL